MFTCNVRILLFSHSVSLSLFVFFFFFGLFTFSSSRAPLSLCPQVRRHAVGVLSQLLAEDFIKLRGSMFFRLAHCLGDHDARVRALAEQVLGDESVVCSFITIG